MPKLLLLRHAKAERARAGGGDHERRLSERGRDDSTTIGRLLAERGDAPDLVLCSTSARTRETWAIVSAELDDPPEPRFFRELYEGADYLRILRREGNGADTVLVIGHNPTMHETALRLAGGDDGPYAKELSRHFPTAALAILEIDKTWAGLKIGRAKLADFICPAGAAGD